jgi:hypothetical protein
MSKYGFRNEAYRDELVKYAYPFSEDSNLISRNGLTIGNDLVLDAILHFKTPVELPVHISTVDGTTGNTADFSFILSDNTGAIVARAAVIQGEEKAQVLNNDGVDIGFILVTEDGFNRFSGEVSGKVISLFNDVAKFNLDVCNVSTVQHTRYVAVDDSHATDRVKIVARHGVRFSVNDGKVSLDIVGDVPLTNNVPVVSVNGVENVSIWLDHHPESNLRIAIVDGILTFLAAGDDT